MNPIIPRRFAGLQLVLAVFFLCLIPDVGWSQGPDRKNNETAAPIPLALKKAEKLFKDQNWAEARAAYDVARDIEKDWRSQPVRMAVEGAVACTIRLQQWDDALARAEMFIQKTRESFEEAVGERFLAGLYLSIPHRGTKQGGAFLRGQSTQGVYVYSWNKDRRQALCHYERARDLLIDLSKTIGSGENPDTPERRQLLDAERIGTDFDLASALAQQHNHNYYSWSWFGWWWWTGPTETEENSEAVEEADYEEPRAWGGWGSANAQPPTGIPVGSGGKLQFIATPAAYSPQLGDGAKIRFLLREIEQLDASEQRNDAARAMLRQAMIARSLYGPDSVQQWNRTGVRYDRFGRCLPRTEDLDQPSTKIWELSDNEAITFVGGRLRAVALPPEESPMDILRQIERKYPKCAILPEAIYSAALYFQTRQQFPKALAEYERLLELYPKDARVVSAKAQIALIKQPEVVLGNTGIHLPGEKPKLAFTYRNVTKVDFTATRFDLVKFFNGRIQGEDANTCYSRSLDQALSENNRWKKCMAGKVATWSENVELPKDHRVGEGTTLAPLVEPGAYVVEVRIPGQEPSRVIVLVTDIAIVQKNMADKGLIYVVDARTGQPTAGKEVRVFETWSIYLQTKQKNLRKWRVSSLTTNADGIIEYSRKEKDHSSQIDAMVVGENHRMAFSLFQNWDEQDWGKYQENGPRYYVITDRPVYRPGSNVKFRVWTRELTNGVYALEPGRRSVEIEIYDPKGNRATTLSLQAEASGGASGEFQLGAEPPLGVYQICVNGYRPEQRVSAGALFRVEEYKKPEFEVNVTPEKTQARLGDKIKAKIEARYYFGAPVARGRLAYKVYRENYDHVYWGPAEYDWLYGQGYGRCLYPYPWFHWWGRWGYHCLPYWGWPYWNHRSGYPPWRYGGYTDENWRSTYESGTRRALRELVAQGEAALKPDGSCEVEIDTAPAKRELGNHDHRYTVEAEVRDESRRTIEGKGSVTATRQEFYAFVETTNGWYQPRNEAFIEVRTITPDNVPVATQGEVIVYRIRYEGANHSEAREEIVKQWKAETDAQGRLSFKYPIPGEGQYRVAYRTRDSWKEEVLGNAVFWVYGPSFDGRVYRFNDLEIIADKRTYRVGDVAHLLVNVAENNSRLLFSDEVRGGSLLSYRLVDLPSRTTVIDVPIQEKHVPNFFVEATLVRNGRVHTESREIFVPPVKALLNLAIETDKAVYRPGEKGKVRVAVTDLSGKPVPSQITLTAFDESVTYIQDEFGPGPKVFFHGQRRYHQPYVDASLNETFAPTGSLTCPENRVYEGGVPDSWNGVWPSSTPVLLDGLKKGNEFAAESGPAGFCSMGSGGLNIYYTGGHVAWCKSLEAGNDFWGPSDGPVSTSFVSDQRTSSVPEPGLVAPEIRRNFADTAAWLPELKTGEDGKVEADLVFPQSLTTWRLHGYALTLATQVGDAVSKATTRKDFIVRLQAPRFFMERDEVVLSANVHNYLKKAKKVTAELIVPSKLFRYLGEISEWPAPDKNGDIHLLAQAKVAPGGEQRLNWPLKVLKEGLARITVRALTDQESDAVQMAFPVRIHGINKTIAQNGSYRVDDDGERRIKLDLPELIDPEQTRLELTLSPSLAGVMIDAMPYLIGYPYGCVEQTMSRFYPTVLVADTLKKMGADLEGIGKQRRQMNPADLKNRFESGYAYSPVFNSDEMSRMIQAGLDRLYSFQRADGGWGWWREDDSSPSQTAYVLQGLQAALQAGVRVDRNVYERGLNFLQTSIRRELKKPENERQLCDIQTQAYLAYVLSLENRLEGTERKKWLDHLYESRAHLNHYGRALLALAFHQMKQTERAQMLLRNVLQFVERDDSNDTAWVRTPDAGWWFWWNNDIETNAWVLKAMVAIDSQNGLAPRLVKWLLNNRRNGYYWRSTRDTALVIAAMNDYMRVSGEAAPDYDLIVNVDGKPMREIHLSKENFFTFDNRVALYGLHVQPGAHEITLTKKGKGALYYSAYLSYFTREENVKGAGNEIFVTRDYFKLVPRSETVKVPAPGLANEPPAAQGAPEDQAGRTELRSGYTRVPLKSGDTVKSGDQIEVVLKIKARNTYDYLAFEDMKLAGCEPVELRSGGRWAGGLCANLELRDEKVVFFIGLLEQGEHILRYRLRAEIPGKFHALPVTGFAMYAPEVRAISDEMRLGIKD